MVEQQTFKSKIIPAVKGRMHGRSWSDRPSQRELNRLAKSSEDELRKYKSKAAFDFEHT